MAEGGGISVFIGTRGGATVLAVAAVAVAVALTPVITGGGGGDTITCDQTAATGAGLTSAISAASNGQTICLTAATSYGSFTGTSKTVTIISQSGTGAPSPVANSMTVAFASGDSGFTIDGGMARWDSPVGLSINGGTITTGASNITLKNFKSTGCGTLGCRLWTFDPSPTNSNILFDHWVVHDVTGGEAVFYVEPSSGTTDTGLTFQRGLLINTSNDGFKVSGDNPVHILGNKCIDSHESNGGDGNHTDCIQVLLGQNHEIVGNWIEDCDQGIFADDGAGSLTITNNVIVNCGEHWITVGGDAPGSDISNNTLVSTAGFNPTTDPMIICGNNAVNDPFGGTMPRSTSSIIDNVAREIDLPGTGGGLTCIPDANHHNLLNSGESTTGTGGSNFTGTTSFAGGSDPLTFDEFADFCLTTGSGGLTGASDGGQVGMCGDGFDPVTQGPPTGEGY